jgi:hypothetical protein
MEKVPVNLVDLAGRHEIFDHVVSEGIAEFSFGIEKLVAQFRHRAHPFQYLSGVFGPL